MYSNRMQIAYGKPLKIAVYLFLFLLLPALAILDCARKTSLSFALSEVKKHDSVCFVDDHGSAEVEFKDTDGDGIFDYIYDNRMPKEPFRIELISNEDVKVAKKEIRRRNLHQMSVYYYNRAGLDLRYCHYFLYGTFLRGCWKVGLDGDVGIRGVL